MDFNVNVKFDATPALLSGVNALAAALGGVVQPAQVVNLSTEVPVSVENISKLTEQIAVTSSESGQVGEGKPKEITDEELRNIVGPKTKEFGKEVVFTILNEMGVKRVPDLNQEQRVVFIEKLRAL